MTKELKTLKELDQENSSWDYEVGKRFVWSDNLRAEAIKWVKALEERKKDCYHKLNIKPDPQWINYLERYDGAINHFKHFFNLTEEDLK